MRVRLKGINTVRRYRKDGTFALYRYHRATGRQLAGEPGTPEFIESYAAAERSLRERLKGSIADAIRRFEGTEERPNPIWEDFEESTRVEYQRKFKIIDRKWGSAPISAFNEKEFRKDVLDWRDQVAKRARREADNLVSALSRVGSWLFDRAAPSLAPHQPPFGYLLRLDNARFRKRLKRNSLDISMEAF